MALVGDQRQGLEYDNDRFWFCQKLVNLWRRKVEEWMLRMTSVTRSKRHQPRGIKSEVPKRDCCHKPQIYQSLDGPCNAQRYHETCECDGNPGLSIRPTDWMNVEVQLSKRLEPRCSVLKAARSDGGLVLYIAALVLLQLSDYYWEGKKVIQSRSRAGPFLAPFESQSFLALASLGVILLTC